MTHPTAYCYAPFNLRHHLAGHPENRERLRGVWSLLQSEGALAGLLEVPCTAASDEQLLRVHGRLMALIVPELRRSPIVARR